MEMEVWRKAFWARGIDPVLVRVLQGNKTNRMCVYMCTSCIVLSQVRLFATPWTVSHQAHIHTHKHTHIHTLYIYVKGCIVRNRLMWLWKASPKICRVSQWALASVESYSSSPKTGRCETQGQPVFSFSLKAGKKSHVPVWRDSTRNNSLLLRAGSALCSIHAFCRLDEAHPQGEGNLLYSVYPFRC